MAKKILTIIFLVSLFISCGQKEESKEVLFVCTHGAARSPIAAAYFNKIAKEKNLNYHAVFRGTEPDKVLTKETISGLAKDDFQIDNWKPEKVSNNDIAKAHKIVTFDCSLPENDSSEKNLEQWNGTPSISKDYDKARNSIEAKVRVLAEQLLEK